MSDARRWAERKISASLPEGQSVGNRLTPIDAVEYLSTVRCGLVASARGLAENMSSFAWLWHLRRIDPLIVRGYLPNTETAIMRIAENISSASDRAPEKDRGLVTSPSIFFDSHPINLQVIARMLAISEAIDRVEGGLRRAQKGAEFEVRAGGFPDLVEDLELEGLIEIYDKRAASVSSDWNPFLKRDLPGEDSNFPNFLDLRKVVGGFQLVPGWHGAANSRIYQRVPGQFVMGSRSLHEFASSEEFRGFVGRMPEAQYVRSLLLLARILLVRAGLSPTMGTSVPLVGYACFPHADLKALVELWHESPDLRISIEDDMEGPEASRLLDSLLERKLWGENSSYGPVLRKGPGVLAVDLFALTVEINENLQIDPSKGGALVNIPSFGFEQFVQSSIDESPLAPPRYVRDLRGVSLRSNGKTITDIDALFCRHGTLYIVSCKRPEFSREYDSGSHRNVRNVATTVEKATKDWLNVVALLERQPVGDNFDLSSFGRIVGIVVTPFLAFVRDRDLFSQLNENVPGLSRYMSFGELAIVLDG
ncbi:MAG: hypothetical protein K0R97_13 [Oerskovia sp.]|nr:hypothetical protein [Oerskovia sp.]